MKNKKQKLEKQEKIIIKVQIHINLELFARVLSYNKMYTRTTILSKEGFMSQEFSIIVLQLKLRGTHERLAPLILPETKRET